MEEKRGRRRETRGFALLVVIVLLGSLVGVAWGLAGMLRVSHRQVDVQYEDLEVRQAAWNAAMLGLAKLQGWMGEDRRASAPVAYLQEGDLTRLRLGEDVRNAGWILEEAGEYESEFKAEDLVSGAWDTQGDFLGWLGIKGESGLWREVVPGIEVQLQQGDPAEARVDEVTGRVEADRSASLFYTYWIADEGVKASIQSWEKPDDPLAEEGYSEEIPNWGKLGPLQWDSPVQNAAAFLDHLPDSRTGGLSFYELQERQQVLFKDRDYEQGVVTWRGKEYDLSVTRDRRLLERALFHTTTLQHTGLLTQPKKGGMKQDLLTEPAEGFSDWLANRSRLDPQNGLLMEVDDKTHPVLTSFKLQFMLIRKQNRLYLRQRLFARWWNPYTSTLVFMDPLRLGLEITGLPERMEIYRNDQLWGTCNLMEIVTQAYPGSQSGHMRVTFPFPRQFWLPGRTWHWAGIHEKQGEAFFNPPNMTNATYQRDYPLDLWIYPEYDLPGTLYALEYPGTEAGNRGMRLFIGVYNGMGWTFPQTVETSEEGMVFHEARIGPGPVEELIPDQPSGGETHIGYRIRMHESGYYGPEASAEQRGDWLRRDIRDRKLLASPGAGGHYEYYPDPTAYQSIQSEIGLEGPDYRRLDTRPLMGPNALRASMDFPLFEHLWQAPRTLASLQHLNFEEQAPYSLGNPWGGAVNRWFDEVYLGNDQEDGVPHPFIRKVEPRDRQEPQYVVKGAFNVNSVHAGAWQSLLERAFHPEWVFWQRDEQGRLQDAVSTRLERAYFRFSQSAAAVFDLGMKTSAETSVANIPPREYFLRGVREFSRSQIARLAAQVVSEIKDYHRGTGDYAQNGGQPFLSVQEFVNAGVLQQAIERSGLNRLEALEEWWDEDPETMLDKRARDDPFGHHFGGQRYDQDAAEIWQRTPFHLSQADILAAVDPLLTVRSDTWLIRGYAEKHPRPQWEMASSPRAIAQVELWVQRVYDLHEGTGKRYQRRFRIIGVRWL